MTSRSTNRTATGSGSTLLGLLTIAFIVLRLLGVITWSWWWVLAPTWVPIAVALLGIGIVIAIALFRKVSR